MTTKIDPYLFFDGDCAEAIRFYQQVLGAELETMMKYEDAPQDASAGEHEGCASPDGGPPPAEWGERIMHASLLLDGQRLMASDTPPGTYEKPAGVAIALNVGTVDEAERAFGALAEGGQVTMPLCETFWSPRFGMLTDRFGISWMVGAAPAA